MSYVVIRSKFVSRKTFAEGSVCISPPR